MLSLLLGLAVTNPWSHYGGSHAGDRYASAVQISRKTTHELRVAWTFRTGDASDGRAHFGKKSSFKATPVLFGEVLIFPTGFNRVLAIDATTGRQRWRFDPRVDFSHPYSEQFTARGVELWRDPQRPAVCKARVFFGTLDAKLWALDAKTGKPCLAFGRGGWIDLKRGIRGVRREDYSVTSPPLAIGDVVVVGSSIGDNGAVRLESGAVRAYDARTGKQRWRFDPAPSGAGGANVWTAMSADRPRGLVFLPTTSPSPDFFGGHRPKNDGHANSLVAVRAATGEVVWHYRIVRHDLWDYDLASQPLLLDWPVGDATRPAVAVATKMGFVFVLDRETGQPLVKVEERAVPASNVPQEASAARQRFSSIQLHPVGPELPRLWAHTAAQKERCARMLRGVRYDGLFTPPSLTGSLMYPGNFGGANWGSMSLHPGQNTMFVIINRLPTVVKLMPRKVFRASAKARILNGEPAQFTAMAGTPYGMARFDVYHRPDSAPCFEGPWAQLVAVEVGTG
ncbi:MAG: PQQ-binding-like beta-propeller repeat protein, partial [Myxococcota bacterium]